MPLGLALIPLSQQRWRRSREEQLLLVLYLYLRFSRWSRTSDL